MNIYDLITLLSVLRAQKSIVPFWGKWFTTSMEFETESIAFDKVSDDYRKLAPFVAPNVQGRVQKQSGYSTTSYTPAYVKPLDAVRPNQTLVRRAGESLVTGSLTPQQRYAVIVGNLLAGQKIKIDNRLEWMRAQALIYGKVTLEGKDYPKVTVDFQRDPSLTITLTGSAKWDQGTATPLKDLGTGKTAVNGLCGAVCRDFVFGANAWTLFYAKIDPLKIQNNTIRGSEGTISAFLDGLEGVEFAGTIAGVNGAGLMNLYVYTQKYLDEAGVAQDMLDTNTVVGLSDMIQGVDCFGAIEDFDSLVATKYFPKMWKADNPSRTLLMTQSAPLTVPKQPNAGFCIKVA